MTKPSIEGYTPKRLDVTVPDGCPLCDGAIHLRLTPGGAWGVCKRCEFITATEVSHDAGDRYQLSYPPGGDA